eukprot:gene293-166_t
MEDRKKKEDHDETDPPFQCGVSPLDPSPSRTSLFIFLFSTGGGEIVPS